MPDKSEINYLSTLAKHHEWKRAYPHISTVSLLLYYSNALYSLLTRPE